MARSIHVWNAHLRIPWLIVAVATMLMLASPGTTIAESIAGRSPTTMNSSTMATDATPEPGTGSGLGLEPPHVPETGAYLGAWINPGHLVKQKDMPGAAALKQLPAFAQAVGKVPAIMNLYAPWSTPLPTATLQAIAAQGAIPLLSWGCASTAAVTAGSDDARITAYAQGLKDFGHPVFLRWFWEMNIPQQWKGSDCLGSGGSDGYIAAWKHVWTIFHQVGATNVAFVWCPGVSTGIPGMAAYFPGPSFVDWIGVDGYDRKSQGHAAFANVFGDWYSAYAGFGKPLMIAETGALPNDQVAFLQGIQSALPGQFPAIKAVVYFDAPGPHGQWQLVGDGLAAFRTLAADPYFLPKP